MWWLRNLEGCYQIVKNLNQNTTFVVRLDKYDESELAIIHLVSIISLTILGIGVLRLLRRLYAYTIKAI